MSPTHRINYYFENIDEIWLLTLKILMKFGNKMLNPEVKQNQYYDQEIQEVA